MRLQEAQNLCGPTALSNALWALGRDIPPTACATLCGTTVYGTDEKDIVRAVKELGFDPIVVRNWFSLTGVIAGGSPVVCYVPEDEHWVAAVGTLGDLLIVVDSVDQNLFQPYKQADWLELWKGPRGYYGIALV